MLDPYRFVLHLLQNISPLLPTSGPLHVEEMGPNIKFLDTRLRMIKDERYADED